MLTILPIKFVYFILCCKALVTAWGISSLSSSSLLLSFSSKKEVEIRSLSRFYRQCFHFCGIDITHTLAHTLKQNFCFIYIDCAFAVAVVQDFLVVTPKKNLTFICIWHNKWLFFNMCVCLSVISFLFLYQIFQHNFCVLFYLHWDLLFVF